MRADFWANDDFYCELNVDKAGSEGLKRTLCVRQKKWDPAVYHEGRKVSLKMYMKVQGTTEGTKEGLVEGWAFLRECRVVPLTQG